VRILKALDLRPRRTIRVVLFTNEENGLRGGRAYAAEHREELTKHVVAIESDGGGARPKGFGVSGGPGAVDVVRSIAARLRALGADDVVEGGGGADISPTREAGVPQMGLRQDGTYYFDYQHSAADTLDKVDPSDLAINVAAMAVMAYSLAEREQPLPRIPPAPTAAPAGEPAAPHPPRK
jgi:carboxypeptidase Q